MYRAILSSTAFLLIGVHSHAGQQPPPKAELKQLLTDIKSTDENTAVRALMSLADYGPQAEPAIADLITAVEGRSEDRRLNAAIVLGKVGKAAVPPLAKLLDSKDEDTRFYAISALAWIGPDAKDTAPAIVKALADKSDSNRRKAAYALGRIAPKAEIALPVLLAAFDDPNADVRAAASEAVGKFGAAAVPSLVKAMRENKTPKSVQAARAVAEIGSAAKDAVPVLKDWLYATDSQWRQEAQEILPKLGKPAVPVLLEAAKSGDGRTRVAAVHALSKVGAEAVPELVDLLGSKHVDVRRAAAQALMPMRVSDKMVVLGLAYGLKDDDEMVRFSCVQGLQQLGTLATLAIPKLKEALNDINANVRTTAFYCLSGMGEDPRPNLLKQLQAKDAAIRITAAALLVTTNSDNTTALAVLRDGLKEKDINLRMQAAFTIVQRGIRDKSVAEVFSDGLQSKSAGVREQAIQGLQMVGNLGRAAAPTLLEIIQNDPEPNIKQQAMYALQQVGGDPKLMLPALKKMLADDSPSVRLTAVQVVWTCGADAIPLLIERFDDKDASVRQNAIGMLGNVQPDKNSLPHIRPLLKHKDANVRGSAVQLLSRTGGAAAEEMMDLLKDSDDNVRWQTFHALRNMKVSTKKLLPILTEMVKTEKDDARKRTFAVQAVAQLGPEAFPTLFEVLKTETDATVRANALIHMGQVGRGSKAAVDYLIDALKDKDAQVRWSAASALASIGPNAKVAIPNLIEALKDEDANVRNNATAALMVQGNDALTPLVKSLATGNSYSRSAALQIFQNFNYRNKEMVPGLIDCLKDKSPTVRAQACVPLGQMGVDAKAAVPVLRGLLKDTDQRVSSAAQTALNAIEPKKK